MKISLVGALILIPSLLLGCDDAKDEEKTLTIAEFKEQMLEFRGDDSIDCGDVYIENTADPNKVFLASQCAFDAYTLALPFYVLYQTDGIHSAAYEGYAFDGKLYHRGLYWDAYEKPPLGEIMLTTCSSAKVGSGNLFNFDCEN